MSEHRDAAVGLTHAEAMDLIFERFFNRSPENGYSFAEFKGDALTILEAAQAGRALTRAARPGRCSECGMLAHKWKHQCSQDE